MRENPPEYKSKDVKVEEKVKKIGQSKDKSRAGGPTNRNFKPRHKTQERKLSKK